MILTTDICSQNCTKMSDVSRSFLVDSLILKKPKAEHLQVSPTDKTAERTFTIKGSWNIWFSAPAVSSKPSSFPLFPQTSGYRRWPTRSVLPMVSIGYHVKSPRYTKSWYGYPYQYPVHPLQLQWAASAATGSSALCSSNIATAATTNKSTATATIA